MVNVISDYSVGTVILICAGVFLSGLVDAIGGGGGLISLPAYILAGLPTHNAIATNKLSSSIGTVASTVRYISKGYYSRKMAIPSAVLAIAGAHIGARLQLLVDEKFSGYILLAVIAFVAFMLLKDKDFTSNRKISFRKQLFFVLSASLIIGIYDGFYGPGTGTFLLMAYCKLAGMDLNEAAGTVKIVNLSSNIGALATMLTAGKVLVPIGLTAAMFAFLGQYIGAGLMIKNGKKIVKPVILTVIVLLVVKVLTEKI